MSLTGSLSIARSGMSATQARAQVVSTNIANVSTAGYVRQETSVEAQGGGAGVLVTGTSRSQDAVLVAARRDAQGQVARSDTVDIALSRSLSAFGQPGDETGIFGAFTQFSSDLQTLKATPESAASQSLTVSSLIDLTDAISSASASIQDERTNADAAIAADVEIANQITANLYELNADIRSAYAGANNANAMLDQRDMLLDELSRIIPFDATFDDAGAVSVKTQTGLNLVGATVGEIEFTPAVRVGALDTNTDQGGRLSIPTIGGRPIAPGTGVHAVTEGRLSANLDLRDSVMTEQAAGLDTFAYNLASAFDALGEPLLLDGSNPIDPANMTGLSERLLVNPAVDPNKGGLASRLRDGLAATLPGAPSDDTLLSQFAEAVSPFGDQLGSVISNVSTQALRAQRIHSGNVAREIAMTEAEASRSGVDLDNELQSLLVIEQAYSANARVIQTVSDMFDVLARL